MELTEGTLLGGRVVYRQPARGYRTGIEPVLLAASVVAAPGIRVLEAGTGAGAGLLCLLARVPGAIGCGVERDGALAALAQANLAANGMQSATIMAGDVSAMPAHPAFEPGFDHAMANPPWHDPGGTASADGLREAAKRSHGALLAEWAASMAGKVRPGGRVTFIVPAAVLSGTLASLEAAGCGGHEVFPFWPRAAQEARLVLVRSRKAGRGPCRILHGLVLHDADGFSAPARAVLWDGAPLAWD